MSKKTLLRMVLSVQVKLNASRVRFVNNLSQVFYKVGGVWVRYPIGDIVDIATMGRTN